MWFTKLLRCLSGKDTTVAKSVATTNTATPVADSASGQSVDVIPPAVTLRGAQVSTDGSVIYQAFATRGRRVRYLGTRRVSIA